MGMTGPRGRVALQCDRKLKGGGCGCYRKGRRGISPGRPSSEQRNSDGLRVAPLDRNSLTVQIVGLLVERRQRGLDLFLIG